MSIRKTNQDMVHAFHSDGHTGQHVVFCVIDSGVTEFDYLTGKIQYADEYHEDQLPPHGHGTFVASQLISACPDATVLSYCVFPNGKGNTVLINNALADVLKMAKANRNTQYICNMSLACNFGSNVMTAGYAKMKNLIHQLNAARVPVYVAAGNDGSEQLYVYPSRWEDPVCIAGLANNASAAPFSTWHDQCDFADESVNVKGLLANGREGTMSGTSMACPSAAAKAGLLASKIHNTTGSWPSEMQLYEEMKRCAIDVIDVGVDKHSGYGFVDIRKAGDVFKELDSEEIPTPIGWCVRNLIDQVFDRFRKRFSIAAAATYSRLLRKGMTGADVRAVKDKLVEIGYLKNSTHATFGADTYKAVRKYQEDNKLEVDGVVGPATWTALFKEDQDVGGGQSSASDASIPMWTRDLYFGMSGSDVRAAKDRLVELGYLHASTKDSFGTDTRNAVDTLQRHNSLNATGVIDQSTWDVIFSANVNKPILVAPDSITIPEHIINGREAIANAMALVSEERRNMCLTALQYAVDPYNPGAFPHAFYIRGGNLYNSDLSINAMTRAKLKSYFAKPNYAPYYDGGRKEMMYAASEVYDYCVPGADCSGGVVGWWRKAKTQGSGFDANANSLYSRYCSNTTNPMPGDLAWREGHIGLVVGGGYVVEFAGGAYGLQLTKISDRRLYNYVDRKLHKFSAWSKFGKPKAY